MADQLNPESENKSRVHAIRQHLLELTRNGKKWHLFFMSLAFIAVLGTVLSLVTRMTLLSDDSGSRPRIAVVGPQGYFGEAMRRGVEMYLAELNRNGGYNGRPVEAVQLEENGEAAGNIARDERIIGVVGYLRPELLAAAAPVLADKKIQIVTPQALAKPLPGVISINIDPHEQARFAGNYARNIVQQRLMYVVRQSGSEFDPLVEPFMDVYARFDTPVRKVWTLTPGGDVDGKIAEAIKAISELGIGAVYVATGPELAAQVITRIRASGNAVEFFGPAQLASNAFIQEIERIKGKDAAIQTHGVVTATPVLFDTANEDAQRFQNQYQEKFGGKPDWVATVAGDAAQLLLAARQGKAAQQGKTGDLQAGNGVVKLPIQMGIYNGANLISAPIQLLPIAKGAGFNYIDALRQGRVLYVNDRFMYKANVVYVGTSVHEISDFDIKNETVNIDMSVWFRYRGSFSPQDLMIENAVVPFTLSNPEESVESDDMQYRRYRFKTKFRLNFTQAQRAFGQHIAGITFRHRQLNRNNLSYVVDVLGMPTGRDLIDDLGRRHVVSKSTGWQVDNAWVSQELKRERGEGAPQYVGMTGELPMFSAMTLGILLKPAMINARDVVSAEYFIYLAIFGLVGAIFTVATERRKWGMQQWALQSWTLRLIFWPMLLMSFGNLLLDWSFSNSAPSFTRSLVIAYESAWWLLAAWLVDLAVHRFVWSRLEERAQRQIPNLMKRLATFLIFVLAFAGITAYVLNETLTSLLATSGVLAMVIGFAVQSNIANVFSGIILNIERPFRVGDFIKVNNVVGQVKDITWRTTRIEASDGQLVSLANSKVSEALMENYSQVPHGIVAETHFYTSPEGDPEVIVAIINEAVAQSGAIIYKDEPPYDPTARFRGVENVNGYWVGHYSVGYRVAILPKKSAAREQLWTYVRQKFLERGIPLAPLDGCTLPQTLSPQGATAS